MDQIDYKIVGQTMQKLRKSRGITQEQVAEQLNTTVSFISNVENCRTKMNLKVLTHYSRMLNVSVDYFLHGGYAISDKETSELLDLEISRLLQGFSIEEKQKLVKVLKALKYDEKDEAEADRQI